MRFLLHTLLLALLAPSFIAWVRSQSEAQIDKMQKAVFNSPGAEAPLTPVVLASGFGLIAGHVVLGRTLFQLKTWQTVITALLGGAIGVVAYWVRVKGKG